MTETTRGRIVLLEGIHPSAEARLETTGMEIVRMDGSLERSELQSVLREATMLGIRSRTQLDEALIRNAPNLQAIGCFCIGTNQVDLTCSATLGIPVFNAPFSNTRSVAELTLAEIVMLMRRIPQRSADMHAGKWRKSAAGSREVRGRTLGIIGYGHIGSQLSILAEAIGMKVVYHDHISKLPLGNAHPAKDLDELFATSDVVSLHVPATPRHPEHDRCEVPRTDETECPVDQQLAGRRGRDRGSGRGPSRRPTRRRRDRRVSGRTTQWKQCV